MGDETPRKDAPAEDLNSDLVSDWESAFQAEDFMFSPKDGENDFFLGDDSDFASTTGTTYEFTPPPEKELADLPDLDEEPEPSPAAAPTADTATAALGRSALPAWVARLVDIFRAAQLRWRLLSRPQQGLVAISLVALASAPFFLFHSSAPPSTTPSLEATSPPPDSMPQSAAPAESTPAPVTSPEPLTTAKEKVRVKWSLPPFLIPAPPQKDAPRQMSFVQVDITLVLLLDESASPPADKEPMVRDIIYQFFSNQPADELRRYALARGDMNRNLRAWLIKQWPDAPIATIVFNRYHVS